VTGQPDGHPNTEEASSVATARQMLHSDFFIVPLVPIDGILMTENNRSSHF